MEKILIEGGKSLNGSVKVSGAKNAVLPLMAACILNSGVNSFTNVPDLADVRTMARLLVMLGARIEFEKGNLMVDSSDINKWESPYDLVKTMRASVLVLGPLTARFGRARVSFPGGCAIGERPIDQHIKGIKLLGAKINLNQGYVETRVKKLRGKTVPFAVSTVTGTENIMLSAVLAKGETVLFNAACEPEIVELQNCLNKMGAKVSGAGTDIITIRGVDKLDPITSYEIMPDRIEAGTFMVAAAFNEGDLKIFNCKLEHMGALVGKLIQTGAEIRRIKNGVRVKGIDRPDSVDISTLPFPGFPTDMQAQMMVLMCISKGMSMITETIFPQRFMHAAELRRMGGDIKMVGNSAVVRGVPKLSGAKIMTSDLRASASLVLAGIVANGITEISRIYHLDRGYEGLDKKLEKVGARIWREKD